MTCVVRRSVAARMRCRTWWSRGYRSHNPDISSRASMSVSNHRPVKNPCLRGYPESLYNVLATFLEHVRQQTGDRLQSVTAPLLFQRGCV